MIPWIKNVSLFENLSEEVLEEISKVTEMVTFYSGQAIFKDGDEADCLYIIVSGQVLIEKEFKDQKRKVLAILEAGDFFGEMAVVTNAKRCANATVSQESLILRLEKESFIEKMKSNALLSFEILQQVCKRLQVADTEIENLSFQNIPGRIASKILELGDQFGVVVPDGTLIAIDITHATLSEIVGTNRETVSKYLAIFRREGSIEYSNRRITVTDRHKLVAWS